MIRLLLLLLWFLNSDATYRYSGVLRSCSRDVPTDDEFLAEVTTLCGRAVPVLESREKGDAKEMWVSWENTHACYTFIPVLRSCRVVMDTDNSIEFVLHFSAAIKRYMQPHSVVERTFGYD